MPMDAVPRRGKKDLGKSLELSEPQFLSSVNRKCSGHCENYISMSV